MFELLVQCSEQRVDIRTTTEAARVKFVRASDTGFKEDADAMDFVGAGRSA